MSILTIILSPWVLLPLIGAGIGWCTNRLALYMLFHPHQPKRCFFWKIQGVIPKRRENLSEKIATALQEELLTLEDQKSLLDTIELVEPIDCMVTQILERQIPKGIFNKIPITEMMREKLIDLVRVQIMKQLPAKISEMDENLVHGLVEQLDIAGHVKSRVLELSLDDLETMIRNIAHKEFAAIEWAGGLIGFLLGIVQVIVLEILDII